MHKYDWLSNGNIFLEMRFDFHLYVANLKLPFFLEDLMWVLLYRNKLFLQCEVLVLQFPSLVPDICNSYLISLHITFWTACLTDFSFLCYSLQGREGLSVNKVTGNCSAPSDNPVLNVAQCLQNRTMICIEFHSTKSGKCQISSGKRLGLEDSQQLWWQLRAKFLTETSCTTSDFSQDMKSSETLPIRPGKCQPIKLWAGLRLSSLRPNSSYPLPPSTFNLKMGPELK